MFNHFNSESDWTWIGRRKCFDLNFFMQNFESYWLIPPKSCLNFMGIWTFLFCSCNTGTNFWLTLLNNYSLSHQCFVYRLLELSLTFLPSDSIPKMSEIWENMVSGLVCTPFAEADNFIAIMIDLRKRTSDVSKHVLL